MDKCLTADEIWRLLATATKFLFYFVKFKRLKA